MLEHESNGKDSTRSRSWNKVTFAVAVDLTRNLQAQFKTWIPIIDGGNNKDILKYNGIFQVAANYRTNNKRINLGLVVVQRKSWGQNMQLEFSVKIKDQVNQFLFVQFYNGYGESLLDYNKFTRMLRVGFVIKPQDYSIY
jgi:phospholipase A1